MWHGIVLLHQSEVLQVQCSAWQPGCGGPIIAPRHGTCNGRLSMRYSQASMAPYLSGARASIVHSVCSQQAETPEPDAMSMASLSPLVLQRVDAQCPMAKSESTPPQVTRASARWTVLFQRLQHERCTNCNLQCKRTTHAHHSAAPQRPSAAGDVCKFTALHF
jgi:hypothetical protein